MVICNRPMPTPFILLLIFIIDSVYSDLFDIRLADGSTRYMGRLEVFYGGEWGTVCNDGWEYSNTYVVCRQLGFGNPIRSYTFEGDVSQPIQLDDVKCYGLESTLSMCSYSPISKHNCQHLEDMGLECAKAKIFEPRLLDGIYLNSGRLEMVYPNGLGQVCNDSSWTHQNSQVVCRELGYNRVDMLRPGYILSNGVQPSEYEFNCTGDEWRLWDCDVQLDRALNCSNPLKVQCSNDYDNEDGTTVQLVGSYDSNNRGIVEAYLFGVWGTVCAVNWSQADSDVACRQLGFDGADASLHDAAEFDVLSASDKHIHRFAILCNGTEYQLSDCDINIDMIAYGYTHSNDVALTCNMDQGLSGGAIAGMVFGGLAVSFWFYHACLANRRRPQPAANATPSIPVNTPSSANQSAPANDLPPSYDNVLSDPDSYKRPEETPSSPCTPPPAYVNYQFDLNTNNQEINGNV